MTREEAIQVLNMVEAHGLADEAKRMAIEALSADTVSREAWNEVTEEYANTVGAILAVISAPSCLKEVNDLIEPLKVVRCKDCRYFKKIVERSDGGLCHRDIVASAWKENGYCSRGERKGGAE